MLQSEGRSAEKKSKLLTVKTFCIVQGTNSTEMFECRSVEKTKEKKERKRKAVAYFSTNTPTTLWTSIVIHIVNFQLHT